MIRYTRECLEAALDPSDVHPKKLVGIRVFESSWLEGISKAPWWLPLIIFAPIIGWGFSRGVVGFGWLETLGLYAGGWLIWTLIEYLLHRFLFHWTGPSVKERFRHFMMHGYHHVFPNDPVRLVAPPMMSATVGVPLVIVYRLALGPAWWPVFAGTASGYLAYDLLHYYVHHARPRFFLGKWLRNYHLQHHYSGEEARYGVSSPLWDYILGTYKAPKSAAREASAA